MKGNEILKKTSKIFKMPKTKKDAFFTVQEKTIFWVKTQKIVNNTILV